MSVSKTTLLTLNLVHTKGRLLPRLHDILLDLIDKFGIICKQTYAKAKAPLLQQTEAAE